MLTSVDNSFAEYFVCMVLFPSHPSEGNNRQLRRKRKIPIAKDAGDI